MTLIRDPNGAPIGVWVPGPEPKRSWWARARQTAREQFHVREPGFFQVLSLVRL